jgi:diguanylate cyclase (GGDEF)-like protein
VGDEVLERLADAAQSALRQTDTLARHGGEEFVVLLPHTDAEGAYVVAEHLRAAIAAVSVASDQGPVRVTVSAGIAEALPGGDTVDRLVGRADQALYAAKATGRDRGVRWPPEAAAGE